jgi:sugar/nucleoside kinase (ribokinase family)
VGLSGAPDLQDSCRALLERGVGCIAVTDGARGAVVADESGVQQVPAFAADVVDTTGCGDAFSAGFLRGLSLGIARRDAAALGCATAAFVAEGLGSDHGTFALQDVQERVASGAVI